jgi:hypothetical protein
VHAMKAYVGGEMAALVINLGTKWGEWLGSRSACFSLCERPPSVHSIEGLIGLRTGLGGLALTAIELRFLGHSAYSLVTVPTQLFRFRETTQRKEKFWYVDTETKILFRSLS